MAIAWVTSSGLRIVQLLNVVVMSALNEADFVILIAIYRYGVGMGLGRASATASCIICFRKDVAVFERYILCRDVGV